MRGAAASGGTNAQSGESSVPVLVKLNCTPFERFWLEALSDPNDPAAVVPRLFASGERLGGEEVPWLVIERLPYKLNDFPHAVKWDMAAEAIARFHAAAARVRLPDPAPEPPVVARMGVAGMRNLVESGLRVGAPPAAQRLLERLDADWEWLERTCPEAINSSDPHPGNLVCRTPPPARAQTCVIDPLVRIAPWPYDAAYLQANVGDPDARMVERTMLWRERLGLPAGAPADVDRAATLLRGWLSASMWQAAWLPGLPPRGTPEGAASVPGGAEWLARSVRYIEQAASVG